MTRRERLLRTMKGQPVDRLPVSPRFWKFCLAYYGAYTVQNMLRSVDEFDWDMHMGTGAGVRSFFHPSIPAPDTLPPGVTCTGELFETDGVVRVRRVFTTPAGKLSDAWVCPRAGGRFGVAPAPTPAETLLKGPDDLEALRFLRGEVMPAAIRRFVETLAEIGENGYLYPYVRSPFNDLSYVFPVTECLMLPYDNPGFLQQILAFLQEMCVDDIRAHLAAGASSIFISGFHISPSVGWSPRFFRQFFLPLIRQQADLTHDGGALFHYYDDGKCMEILPLLLEVGVDVFETCTPPPAGDFDPRAARALVGERVTLMGYVDIENVLHRGTPSLIEETVREAVAVMGANGRYIVGSSDGILAQTPVENVRAFFEAGKKYGARAA
ncbi:MAG: uroporphyrinogen decarboxylase family protein [Armatimonadota bacterium]|nr:uroporphyrinogen decarboxylase family protein [Armatimonadota bacterium]